MRWNPRHWPPVPSILFVPLLAGVTALLLGTRAGVFVALAWPLFLAWRFDNRVGAFLVIATIVYIVLFVLAFLLTLFVAVHTYSAIGQ